MTIEFGKATQAAGSFITVDAASIAQYLEYSQKLPVLILLSDSSPASEQLGENLKQITEQAAGRILTLKLDAASAPELIQAFEVSQLPAVLAVLKGQPAPLFAGSPPLEQIVQVINRVLEVAKENGLTELYQSETEPEPELSEHHLAAFTAIEQGNYQAALASYQKQLANSPNDAIAEAGVAQVQLLLRLDGQDPAKLVSKAANDFQSKLTLADALVATGDPQRGFDLLLELFENNHDDREQIRLRLLELFLIVGSDDPIVTKARAKLSLLLF